MKRIDLKIINDALMRISDCGNLKHKYGVAKNVTQIKDEIAIIEDLKKSVMETTPTYNKKQYDLLQKLSGGTGHLSISKDKDKYNEFISKNQCLIEETHKTNPQEWVLHDQKQKEFNDLLGEDVSDKYNFYKLSIENMDDNISESDIAILMSYGIID